MLTAHNKEMKRLSLLFRLDIAHVKIANLSPRRTPQERRAFTLAARKYRSTLTDLINLDPPKS